MNIKFRFFKGKHSQKSLKPSNLRIELSLDAKIQIEYENQIFVCLISSIVLIIEHSNNPGEFLQI